MRKWVTTAAIILLCVFASGCKSSGEITFKKLLELESKEDVYKVFGESVSDEYERHESILLETPLDVRATYDSEDDLLQLTMDYELVGTRDLVLAMDLLAYEATREDIKEAEKFSVQLLEYLEKELGKPEIFYSPVETVSYSWVKDGVEIKMQDSINNETLRAMWPVSITIDY